MRTINFVGVFIMLLLGVSLASANVLPCPITVKLIPPADLCEGSYKITIENLRTNAIVTGQTNQYFEYVYDWANFGIGGYQQGDIFRISVLGITQDIKYTGQPPTEFVDMNGNPVDFVRLNVADYCPDGCIVTVTKTKTVTEYVDRIVNMETPVYVDKIVEVVKEVPVEVEKIIERIEKVEVPQECPDCITEVETGWQKYIGLIVGLMAIIAVFAGGGWKIYKNKKGEATIQHRHLGIKDYHNPDTRHTNPKYRHRLFKDDPAGCLADVKKINDGIDLSIPEGEQ